MSMRHRNHESEVGNVYGRLTVIADFFDGRAKCTVRCECGTEKTVQRDHIRAGRTKSCGCLQSELTTKRCVKDGFKRGGSPTYIVYLGMIRRCYRTKEPGYPNYGGRGISICERWRGKDGFKNFLADMGEKPDGLSIDRIDNDGNYEPSNCRWATRTQQARNCRSNRRYTFNGESLCVPEWAERLGMKADTIYCRLKIGWSIEKALTAPPFWRGK